MMIAKTMIAKTMIAKTVWKMYGVV